MDSCIEPNFFIGLFQIIRASCHLQMGVSIHWTGLLDCFFIILLPNLTKKCHTN